MPNCWISWKRYPAITITEMSRSFLGATGIERDDDGGREREKDRLHRLDSGDPDSVPARRLGSGRARQALGISFQFWADA